MCCFAHLLAGRAREIWISSSRWWGALLGKCHFFTLLLIIWLMIVISVSVPLCYVYPAMLHYKACARTLREKVADILLMVFGWLAAIYTTVQTISVRQPPPPLSPFLLLKKNADLSVICAVDGSTSRRQPVVRPVRLLKPIGWTFMKLELLTALRYSEER